MQYNSGQKNGGIDMSLHPQSSNAVPGLTVEVVRAAFSKGNRYMILRDKLSTIYEDEQFIVLYPSRGQPALAPWRLALVSVMQFVENLMDRQAADAVRAQIDWKYVLGLNLNEAGFDFSVLSEFRKRLLEGSAEEVLLNRLLDLFKARSCQRTDSTHGVWAVIRTLDTCALRNSPSYSSHQVRTIHNAVLSYG